MRLGWSSNTRPSRTTTDNEVLRKELSEVLEIVKQAFKMLETDGATSHRVLYVINLLLNGGLLLDKISNQKGVNKNISQ
jgi:hypothetical protein